METFREFMDRDVPYDEIAQMHARNAHPNWDKPHSHGMLVTRGDGPYLEGIVPTKDGEKPVRAVDCHGQILCNAAGYGNPEVEEMRQRVRADNIDAFSTNFLSKVIEGVRAAALRTLGPDWCDSYAAHFVTSGTEANDVLRRAAFASGGGVAELISLVDGYSGAGWAANAACGHAAWKGKSTPSLPNMHCIPADMNALRMLARILPPGRFKALMLEAGNFGVGGFFGIPDEFIREATEFVRMQKDGKGEEGGDVFPDEVQTGLGRTGRSFWASQTIFEGMDPPAGISAAKGLGSNHRAALAFLRKDVARGMDGLTYHTFGQNLEDLAATGAVLDIAMRDDWTKNARVRGQELQEGLADQVRKESRIDFSVHGRGLMVGVKLKDAATVNAVLKRAPLDGWICGKGGYQGDILRIAPPINITREVVRDLISAITQTFRSEDVERAAA